jgi:hypothetical protein
MAPPVEVHLERRRVGEPAAERDAAAREPERHDLEPHAERADRVGVRGAHAAEHERADGHVVARREEPQVVVGPQLVAAPGRDREPRQQRQDLQARHSFVVAAWIHTPSVACRR